MWGGGGVVEGQDQLMSAYVLFLFIFYSKYYQTIMKYLDSKTCVSKKTFSIFIDYVSWSVTSDGQSSLII